MSWNVGNTSSASSALYSQRNQVDESGRNTAAAATPTDPGTNSGANFDFFSFFSQANTSREASNPTGFGNGLAPRSNMFGGVNAGPGSFASRVNVGVQTDPTGCFRTVKGAYEAACGSSLGPLSSALPATAGTQGMEELKARLASGQPCAVAVHRENGRTDVNRGSYGAANHCVMLVPQPDGTISVQDPANRQFNRGSTANFDAGGNLTIDSWDRMKVVSMLQPTNSRMA